MISELKLNWRCIMIFLLKWVKFYKIYIFTPPPHIVVKILLWRRVSKFSLLWSWWMTEGLENWLVTSRHTTWKTCNIFHIVSADWDQNFFYMLIWGFYPISIDWFPNWLRHQKLGLFKSFPIISRCWTWNQRAVRCLF